MWVSRLALFFFSFPFQFCAFRRLFPAGGDGGRGGCVCGVLLLFSAEAGERVNDRVGGWEKSEGRMAAGSLCIADRRYIPAMVDAN